MLNWLRDLHATDPWLPTLLGMAVAFILATVAAVACSINNRGNK